MNLAQKMKPIILKIAARYSLCIMSHVSALCFVSPSFYHSFHPRCCCSTFHRGKNLQWIQVQISSNSNCPSVCASVCLYGSSSLLNVISQDGNFFKFGTNVYLISRLRWPHVHLDSRMNWDIVDIFGHIVDIFWPYRGYFLAISWIFLAMTQEFTS